MMKCCSGVQYIGACNCGRWQANREDPFKLVDPNYNFYQQLEEECFKDLERVEAEKLHLCSREIQAKSAPGVKPEFSSWSLIMIGSSHVYSHSSGLGSQPGFMSSSKFLLPWEIPLTKISTKELSEKWPNIVENAAKRASLRGPDEPVDNRITVKVFVGFEYECPRGHRFMVSGPDKPMKSSSTMREAAGKLVQTDLPLYMACPCPSPSPRWPS